MTGFLTHAVVTVSSDGASQTRGSEQSRQRRRTQDELIELEQKLLETWRQRLWETAFEPRLNGRATQIEVVYGPALQVRDRYDAMTLSNRAKDGGDTKHLRQAARDIVAMAQARGWETLKIAGDASLAVIVREEAEAAGYAADDIRVEHRQQNLIRQHVFQPMHGLGKTMQAARNASATGDPAGVGPDAATAVAEAEAEADADANREKAVETAASKPGDVAASAQKPSKPASAAQAAVSTTDTAAKNAAAKDAVAKDALSAGEAEMDSEEDAGEAVAASRPAASSGLGMALRKVGAGTGKDAGTDTAPEVS